MITKRNLFSILSACVLACGLPAFGQSAHAREWPTRSIKIIESFPPGVARDPRTRVIAERLSAILGQQVYVENRPGAGGRIGLQAAITAAPDGYTFNMLGATDILNKYIYDLPYDVERDLIPVSMIETLPVGLIVRASLPFKTVTELIIYAKDHPGEMTYGSTGAGSFFHVNALQFINITNTKFKHVPYGQGNPLTDLLGGHLDMVFDAIPAYLENIKAGNLRALAFAGDKRTILLPNVPTFIESGVPTFDRFALYGISAPKGTPEPIIVRMQMAVLQILRDPGLHRQWVSEGGNPVGSTSAEFAARLRSEGERWGMIVRANSLKIQN